MTNPIKVLVVDDNVDAATSAADLLELAGCVTRVCHDGPAALAEARKFSPDVCVLDVTMPGMDGTELAERLRQDASHPMRLIALTGLWDITATHRTRNAGFDLHLTKSADPERLVEAVLGHKLETV